MAGAVLHVRNWHQFQHYKDRNPPWIKLHFELLASEDWVTLSDASRVLAIACMLLASRNEGKVPANSAYIKRVAYLNSEPDFGPLIACGFLRLEGDASKLQADARPETETETETETENRGISMAGDQPGVQKKRTPKCKKADYTPAFEEWWERTWRRGHKAAAFATWELMEPEEQVAAEEVIDSWSKAFSQRDAQRRPHVSTWLNNRGWDDVVDAEYGTGKGAVDKAIESKYSKFD